MQWYQYESIIFQDSVDTKRNETIILGFDLDSTLIRTKSHKKFPQSASDWEWLYPVVPQMLKQYHNDPKVQLLIFTNQSGISSGKIKQETIIDKFEQIYSELGFHIPTYIASNKDKYRKPSPLIFGVAFQGREIESFTFVGDAAGRPKDFSDSDYKFALNVESYYGVSTIFDVPEHFFLNQKAVGLTLSGYDPTRYQQPKNPTLKISDHQEMIILVGRQASGKSTLAKFYENNGYVVISSDVLKTPAKIIASIKNTLSHGDSVIIDSTAGKAETRKRYIKIAQDYKVPVRIIEMTTPKDLSTHLNKIRGLMGLHEIPEVALRTYDKYFEEPQISEGVSEILKYTFAFDPENDPEFTKLFHLHY
jgi:bifunctional polynucleotide phosphatase/kinase